MKDPIKIALVFMKFRARSVFEVKEKLKSKGIYEEEIDDVISALKENKLLDDQKLAKMWVGDRNLLKPSGSYLLKLEMKKIGLSEADIENALEDQDEEELARRAVESKSKYREADFNHQVQFLARRGFSTNIIYKVLKNNHN